MPENFIRHSDYFYDLPEEKIAKYPLPQRDASKLLVYQNEEISHRVFAEITDYFGPEYRLFFNDTKVIPARLFFRKPTGALIEIFLLNPSRPAEVSAAMSANESCEWVCAVGNLKRIKEGNVLTINTLHENKELYFSAELLQKEEPLVRFSWDRPELSFAEVTEIFGKMPLPPYMKRQEEPADRERYQTVYGRHRGAVAAPTAGLHFTPELIGKLEEKGCAIDRLTLHVAGGTFSPVRHENVLEHPMHAEQISVSRENLENMADGRKIAAVGTTSLRTLESVYWYGVLLSQNPEAEFFVPKLYHAQHGLGNLPTLAESVGFILEKMRGENREKIGGQTEIMIYPGYRFRACEALVTNFHLPGTTLVMLTAAFAGKNWRKIYDSALENDYRFLSFGDSSLLFRGE